MSDIIIIEEHEPVVSAAQEALTYATKNAEKNFENWKRDSKMSDDLNKAIQNLAFNSQSYQWQLPGFSLNRIEDRLRHYISQWKLTKGIKYFIKHVKIDEAPKYNYNIDDYRITLCKIHDIRCKALAKENKIIPPKEYEKHVFDVIFSEPTNANPNPLAVAKVQFVFNEELTKNRFSYTVLDVKYQFEGFKTWHEVDRHNLEFQDEYIRYILDTKNKFYSKILGA